MDNLVDVTHSAWSVNMISRNGGSEVTGATGDLVQEPRQVAFVV